MCEYSIIVFVSLSEISSSMHVNTTFFDLATGQSTLTLVIPDSASFQREGESLNAHCSVGPMMPHRVAERTQLSPFRAISLSTYTNFSN